MLQIANFGFGTREVHLRGIDMVAVRRLGGHGRGLLLAWVVLLVTSFLGSGGVIAAVAGVVLLATVFAAVYHAEVIAHRVGEPFGTLVLALAVTVIETALIVSVMIAAPAEKAGLARDTVFAAVMIVCNGIVGACLLAGGARHHEQGFQLQGASAALAVLAALTNRHSDSSKLRDKPNSGRCTARRSSSSPDLCRWCFMARSCSCRPCGTAIISSRSKLTTRRHTHHRPPTGLRHLSAGLLLVSLVAIVGLAKAPDSHGGVWSSAT